MKIVIVRTTQGQEKAFEVSEAMTISDLREQAERAFELNVGDYRLMFQGRSLQSAERVLDHIIEENTILQLFPNTSQAQPITSIPEFAQNVQIVNIETEFTPFDALDDAVNQMQGEPIVPNIPPLAQMSRTAYMGDDLRVFSTSVIRSLPTMDSLSRYLEGEGDVPSAVDRYSIEHMALNIGNVLQEITAAASQLQEQLGRLNLVPTMANLAQARNIPSTWLDRLPLFNFYTMLSENEMKRVIDGDLAPIDRIRTQLKDQVMNTRLETLLQNRDLQCGFFAQFRYQIKCGIDPWNILTDVLYEHFPKISKVVMEKPAPNFAWSFMSSIRYWIGDTIDTLHHSFQESSKILPKFLHHHIKLLFGELKTATAQIYNWLIQCHNSYLQKQIENYPQPQQTLKKVNLNNMLTEVIQSMNLPPLKICDELQNQYCDVLKNTVAQSRSYVGRNQYKYPNCHKWIHQTNSNVQNKQAKNK